MSNVKDVPQSIKDALLGKKIVAVQFLSKESCDAMYWDSAPMCIVLEDKTALVPMSDDEGNNGGAVTVFTPNGKDKVMYVINSNDAPNG